MFCRSRGKNRGKFHLPWVCLAAGRIHTGHVKVSHQRAAGELFREAAQNKEARGIPANTISVLFFLQGTDTMQLGNWATDKLVSCPVCRAWRD